MPIVMLSMISVNDIGITVIGNSNSSCRMDRGNSTNSSIKNRSSNSCSGCSDYIIIVISLSLLP